MEKKALKQLLDRYINGECTEKEKLWVEQWYNEADSAEEDMPSLTDINADIHEVRTRLGTMEPGRQPRVNWVYAAAALALLIGSVFVFYRLHPTTVPDRSLTAAMDKDMDILPGGNKAQLTVDDGQPIELSSEYTGIVVGNDIAYEDGSVVYADLSAVDQSQALPASASVLQLTTPRGGQYQITLSDGTKVWINAASSLRYPAQFDEATRQVELDGEAYFEVAQAHGKPFHVIAGSQKVEVLGTQFNVSSYADDPYIRTTLVEGSVRISGGPETMGAMLEPGEQATLDKSQRITIAPADVASAVAWKDGLFSFDNMDIETMMRQLSRWYDVDVVFEGEKPDLRLWGNMYRDLNASQALEILAYFNLNFRIENEGGVKRIVIFN